MLFMPLGVRWMVQVPGWVVTPFVFAKYWLTVVRLGVMMMVRCFCCLMLRWW